MMTPEQLKNRIAKLHIIENEFNAENNKCDKQIREILNKKKKLGKRISHNMKYRNKLIGELYEAKKNGVK